jgi:A/G-specific adenine glycosylase
VPSAGVIARRLEAWFPGHARDLPWRTVGADGRRDPWRVLVSEFMLQQTQVSRVVPRFEPFLGMFPTPAAMARAPLDAVTRAWAGLGYYRRAAMLHAAAVAITREHGGAVPAEPAALRALPGVGRYTAGAVASTAFGRREPVVDGNVMRVLLRVHGRPARSDDPAAVSWAWERAGELVTAARAPGVLNEAVMELGATVCTPDSPRCGACPLARVCAARREGTTGTIPVPKSAPRARAVHLLIAVVQDGRGRVLVEPGDSGLWAGLWRPPTITLARAGSRAARDAAARELGSRLGLGTLTPAGRAVRMLTHRLVTFWLYAATDGGRAPRGTRWLADLTAMSSAHRAAVEAVRGSRPRPRR